MKFDYTMIVFKYSVYKIQNVYKMQIEECTMCNICISHSKTRKVNK